MTARTDVRGPSPFTAGGLLRVCIDVRHLAARRLDTLRLLLVADVLHRVYEHLRAGRVICATLDEGSERLSSLTQLATSCGRGAPPTGHVSPADLLDALGGPPAVEIVAADGAHGPDATRRPLVIQVGPVVTTGRVRHLGAPSALGDPLALRLALLRFPPQVPATVSAARLHRADETLDRWRFKVASWRDLPPSRAAALSSLTDPLLAGLDTATVLRLMHRVESDHAIAFGDKYSAFVDLDHVLALDLRRYAGVIRS